MVCINSDRLIQILTSTFDYFDNFDNCLLEKEKTIFRLRLIHPYAIDQNQIYIHKHNKHCEQQQYNLLRHPPHPRHHHLGQYLPYQQCPVIHQTIIHLKFADKHSMALDYSLLFMIVNTINAISVNSKVLQGTDKHPFLKLSFNNGFFVAQLFSNISLLICSFVTNVHFTLIHTTV